LKKESGVKLFVNPTAGGGKTSKLYPAVAGKLHQAGVACDMIISQHPGDITEVSSEFAARGCETVIACGGDGTVNELINGIAGTDTALGIIPVGTANDFATNMGIGKDVDLACTMIMERRTRKIDTRQKRHLTHWTGLHYLPPTSPIGARRWCATMAISVTNPVAREKRMVKMMLCTTRLVRCVDLCYDAKVVKKLTFFGFQKQSAFSPI
jgi:hypothetical protein